MRRISLTPWRSRALSEAAKQAHFRQAMDRAAESIILQRSWIIAGWLVFLAGIGLTGVSIAERTIFKPKPQEDRIFVADRSTGIIQPPVALADVPQQFSPEMDKYWLREYIEACEQWVPEKDKDNYNRCMVMSAPEQQKRYLAWRQLPSSPMRVLGTGGALTISCCRFHHETSANPKLHTWRVQFSKRPQRGMQFEASQLWEAVVDFEWHPEWKFTEEARQLNYGGMLVIDMSTSALTAEKRP